MNTSYSFRTNRWDEIIKARWISFLSTLLVTLMFTGVAYGQQEITVTGQVTDENNDPLPGATIVLEGTEQGTTSDMDGRYMIDVVEDGVLVFSFVGHETKRIPIDGRVSEVPIQGRITINVSLQTQAVVGEELVVVGYGTQRQRDITGAVSQIDSDQIAEYPVSSLEETLQGRSAGVQVRETGGDLYGNFTVLIRGTSSTGGTTPLYVVDGVPLANEFNLSIFNPSDIESIDILKDASATAVYGARASNGVVIITTKTGNRTGKTQVEYSSNFSWEVPSNLPELASSMQFAEVFEQAYLNAGLVVPSNLFTAAQETNNDWPDLMTEIGTRQEHNLSISGGDENTRFFISGNYLTRDGIIINTNFQKTSLRVNFDHQVSQRFNVGARINGSSQWGDQTTTDEFYDAPFRGSLVMRPWIPNKDENGNYVTLPPRTGIYSNFMFNPVAKQETDELKRNVHRFLGNVFFDFEIQENLTLSSNIGVDMNFNEINNFFPKLEIGGLYTRSGSGLTAKIRNNNFNIVTDHTLTYENTFSRNHNVKALVGSTVQKFKTHNVNVSAEGTQINELNQLSNQPDILGYGDSQIENGILSYFSRLNYDYKKKYLFTGTIRRDGSSRFGEDNRFGWFPSASIGWRVSEEQFFKGISTIEDLKFRVSYGLTGNQNIGDLAAIGTVGPGLYAFGNNITSALIPTSFDNDDLKWESNQQFNAGLDITLWDGRLYTTLNYYHRKSNDLLVNVPVAAANGITSRQFANIGEVENEGFEFSLSTHNIVGSNFNWSTDFNISTNRNKVVDLGQDVTGQNRQIFGANFPGPWPEPVNLTKAGTPIGALYGYEWIGIWQEEEAAAAAEYGLLPGDTKYRDLNNDGIINNEDKKIVGQPQPKLYGGFTNQFSYNNLSLSIFLNYQIGHSIINSVRMLQESGHHDIRSTEAYAENFWTPERPSNEYSRPHRFRPAYDNTLPSTRFIEDASFLRLKNVSLTYNFPNRLIQNSALSRASISLIVGNLWTLTNYSGIDPEASSRANSLSVGQDRTPYPLPKSFRADIKVQF